MKNILIFIIITLLCVGCSNSPEIETGEIKTVQVLKEALSNRQSQDIFIDARKLLTREQIDAAGIPVLYVELETGQNGTLTPYPNEGIGKTWLGADGATLTLDYGRIKASRGLGDDLMGSESSIGAWQSVKTGSEYIRKMSYLSGNNEIYTEQLKCTMNMKSDNKTIEIWDVAFEVREYDEKCSFSKGTIQNKYRVDTTGIVRSTHQYHGERLGYIRTERLDR